MGVGAWEQQTEEQYDLVICTPNTGFNSFDWTLSAVQLIKPMSSMGWTMALLPSVLVIPMSKLPTSI